MASVLRHVTAWLLLCIAVALALLMLNSAAFSAWMSGGPPNPFPQGWALRAQEQLAHAGALALGGLDLFRLIRELPALKRQTLGLVLAAAMLGAGPAIHRYLLVDRCLDSGGRWNYEGLQCER